jgi:hypothetical protein
LKKKARRDCKKYISLLLDFGNENTIFNEELEHKGQMRKLKDQSKNSSSSLQESVTIFLNI